MRMHFSMWSSSSIYRQVFILTILLALCLNQRGVIAVEDGEDTENNYLVKNRHLLFRRTDLPDFVDQELPKRPHPLDDGDIINLENMNAVSGLQPLQHGFFGKAMPFRFEKIHPSAKIFRVSGQPLSRARSDNQNVNYRDVMRKILFRMI